MSLTPEWRGRIETWIRTLESLFYTRLGDVPLEGFVTTEQLTPKEALRHAFRPMAPGTPWGGAWEYAWLRGHVRVPPEAQGRRLVFHTSDWPGSYFGEGRILVNGEEAGGRDAMHPILTLARAARAHTRYDLLIELYAGHGATPCHGGPCPEGHLTVPPPPQRQRVLGYTSFGTWEEELYQAWVDLKTLWELRDLLPPDSLRVAEIDEGLRQFTLEADLELPHEALVENVRKARRGLRRLLACRNGSTAPVLYCFGHSHIDVAWLWPLAETARKCARTFATQLALMEEYPEFRFLQSQPHLYVMTRRFYPRLYARIRAAARRGQWIPEGGMWVEADTNLSGGESLIRQLLYGKRFFQEEFGVDCQLLWLPDVFGYSGALPQIMAGCGIRYFSTQKIFWNYNGGETFPYNTFWWEGIDGTRIFSHIHNDYNSMTNPRCLMQRWTERVQKDGPIARLMPFGHGDGGGGPTRLHLEYLRRARDLEGLPRTRLAHPVEFFEAELRRKKDWPVYVGELYYQCHRGTYTTQARTKRGNRRCEMALREAEVWASVAHAKAGRRYPATALGQAWWDLLLSQFHDILPGSSIRRVYEENEALQASILERAGTLAHQAMTALIRPRSGSLTLFNSLSWDRRAWVPLPSGMKGAAVNGESLPAQRIGDLTWVEVTIPSCGWVTLEPCSPLAETTASQVQASEGVLENDVLRVRLNRCGEIVELRDKTTGRDLVAAPMNAFRLYKDIPRGWDAWDIDSMYRLQPVDLDAEARIEIVASGPLVGIVRLQRRIGRSLLDQQIVLHRHSRRLEFRTRVDWREKHRLLKVAFPTTLHTNEAIHEIQFGHLRRPNHASRPFDADRFEVAQQKWSALAEEHAGFAVLNDCKYGISSEGGTLLLTLLRAPLAPDMTADQGQHEFTYAIYVWAGSLFESRVVQEAYELNVDLVPVTGSAGQASLIRTDAPNIVLETLKAAEDGSGDLVLRLYESKRAATMCRLHVDLPFRSAEETDMLERSRRRLPSRGGQIRLSFRPFEIKTLRLRR